MDKKNIKKNNIIDFPKKLSSIEKEIEAIVFAAAEPLDIETIENKISKKTNVEIVEIINSHLIEMRVWERGVGITLACGSGACAAVYAAWKKGFIENNAEVKLEKGSLHINIINNESIMTGPAEISYRGSLEI